MGPPGAERALHAAKPHRPMRRRADLAKHMRPAGRGVECGLGLPVDPADIVLLGGHEQRFREAFVPSAQDLARDPGVGRLADGERAGRLADETACGQANRLRRVAKGRASPPAEGAPRDRRRGRSAEASQGGVHFRLRLNLYNALGAFFCRSATPQLATLSHVLTSSALIVRPAPPSDPSRFVLADK